ncbi:hypothetical protein Y032_0074g875 [Ancylostoma ceylanicum]|uniref:SCP domain-containing protein n=1 Tax=Ancylostoma ceylanicum TaxID=53326 RepID=A0A016TUN6_9BILA|nr:hypothetical protein Y032_0074g875 [Ancylostoma ceylanicum]
MFLPNIALIFVVAIVLPGCLADSYAKPFNCTGQTINDDVREIALYYHNSLRTRINQDQVEDKNKTKLPKAENMYKMIYSCALEEEAAKLVDGCADTYNKSQAHGINFKYFGPGSNPTQLASPLSQILHTWSEQIVTKDWLPNNKYNNDKDLFEFSNMINAKTTAVGCSEAMCGTKASAACVFNEPDVANDQVLYVTGTPCTKDDECKTYTPSTCEVNASLCVKADATPAPPSSSGTTTSGSVATTPSSSTPTTSGSVATTPSSSTPTTSGSVATNSPSGGTTAQPTSSTTPAPSSTTTTPVTTTNAHKDPSINRICPTNSGVNDKIRNKTLEMHNWRRFVPLCTVLIILVGIACAAV